MKKEIKEKIADLIIENLGVSNKKLSDQILELFEEEKQKTKLRNKKSKYWDTMVNILDNCFPKSKCKERGKAIVMLSYIEMMFRGWKFDENGNPLKGSIKINIK